ncbi:MAG: YceI family protein [Planctomycetota bacterium]|nr:YceI family protein [Planctomycetota bacterium]MDA1105374.1 YceI family protein [Planctomycetota bacterium]
MLTPQRWRVFPNRTAALLVLSGAIIPALIAATLDETTNRATVANPGTTTTTTTATLQGTTAKLQTLSTDPVHSCALFRVRHMGAGYFWGRFNGVTGTVTQDGETSLAMDISISIESVDSGNDQLDAHLKSPDFFNGVEFPSMTFKSAASLYKGNGVFEVTGALTIKTVSKQITVSVESFGGSDFGRGFKSGYETAFTIKRSEFGVDYGVEKGVLGDEVRVVVAIEAGAPAQDRAPAATPKGQAK